MLAAGTPPWLGALPGLVGAIAPTWIRRPETPVRAVLAVTRRCNLRCAYCRTYRLPPGQELTAQEIGRLLRALPHLVWLDVTGGEPFVRGDALEVFQAILESAPALRLLHFPTNGWFPERAAECARLATRMRPDMPLLVTVSIDGPPELHDRLRGRRGSHARALRTIELLRGIRGVQTYIGTTIGPLNADVVDSLGASLADAVPGFDPRQWHWNFLQRSSHFFANRELAQVPMDQQLRLIRTHLARRWPPASPVDLMEMAFLVNLTAYLDHGQVGIPCQALHSTCFMSADGVLYPCHLYDRPLADLRREGFRCADVWQSPAVHAARRDVLRLACGGCFTPCEAYPAVTGSPVRALWHSARRGLTLGLQGVRQELTGHESR